MGKRKVISEAPSNEVLDAGVQSGKAEDLIVIDAEIGPACKEGFRWENVHYHLTYKGHQDFEELKTLTKKNFGELSGWSIVHERSDQDQQYDHTHFYFLLPAKVVRRGNIMDLNGVHPHVQKIRNPKHAHAVYKYHQKAPVKIEQEGEDKIPSFGKGYSDSWKHVMELAKEGKVGEIQDLYPGHYLRCERAIKKVASDSAAPVADLEKLCNYWLFGEPNTGKSTWARKWFAQRYPGEKVYVKDARTKWFDGITPEHTCLLIEDPDRGDFQQPGFWKRLFDKFPLPVETKGGSCNIRPKCIIVTSNYSPEQCFTGIDLEAMVARMSTIKATKVFSAKKDFDEEDLAEVLKEPGFELVQVEPMAFASQKEFDKEEAREKRLGSFLEKQE